MAWPRFTDWSGAILLAAQASAGSHSSRHMLPAAAARCRPPALGRPMPPCPAGIALHCKAFQIPTQRFRQAPDPSFNVLLLHQVSSLTLSSNFSAAERAHIADRRICEIGPDQITCTIWYVPAWVGPFLQALPRAAQKEKQAPNIGPKSVSSAAMLKEGEDGEGSDTPDNATATIGS